MGPRSDVERLPNKVIVFVGDREASGIVKYAGKQLHIYPNHGYYQHG